MAAIEFGNDGEQNKEVLEKWLESQNNQELNTAIAHRAAMRVSYEIAKMALVHAGGNLSELLVPASYKCLLLSSFTSILIGEDIRMAAIYAARSTKDFPETSLDCAIISAANSAGSVRYFAYSSAVSSVVNASFFDSSLWQNVANDICYCEEYRDITSLMSLPLFKGEGWDDDAFEVVDKLGELPEYQFWSKWILECYHGKKRSEREWEMLREIALIDNDIWEQGAKAVADEIANIEERYRAEANERKNARVEAAVQAQLRVASLTIENAEGLRKTLDQIVQEITAGTNEKPEIALILENISAILEGMSHATKDQNSDVYRDRILELEAEVRRLTEELEKAEAERDKAKDDNRAKEWKIFNEELAKGSAVTVNWAVRLGLGYFMYQINPSLVESFGELMTKLK